MVTLSRKQYLEEFKKKAEAINTSKQSAMAFYQKVGFLTPTGRITKQYRNVPSGDNSGPVRKYQISLYTSGDGLIIGFHGCDKSVRDKIISTKGEVLKPSDNDYDWLGQGIYFWEGNARRALNFAKYLSKNPPHNKKQTIKNPSALGAVIDLGYCFNLLDSENLQELKLAFNTLEKSSDQFGIKMPENVPLKQNGDLLKRYLDCAVIETAVQLNKDITNKEYDSVRGVFFEGKELYPNAGFKDKNHIQIALRNPNCVKGYFAPRELDSNYSRV